MLAEVDCAGAEAAFLEDPAAAEEGGGGETLVVEGPDAAVPCC